MCKKFHLLISTLWKLMKTIDDLNLSIANLTAAVDALPGRLPQPIDLTAQVEAIDAQTAKVNAINPPTP